MRILAEMQTPSQVFPLDLKPAESDDDNMVKSASEGLDYGQSLQKIVRFDLKEEGNHILAVSVSYTETLLADTHDALATTTNVASGGRVRTFRKLYQFIAQPCLSVRTKASELTPAEVDNKSLGPYGKTRLLRFALEAQLENVGDGSVVIEVRLPCVYQANSVLFQALMIVQKTNLNPKPPFKSTSLNWDVQQLPENEDENAQRPTMNPRDILQVAFLVEQEVGQQDGLDTLLKDLKKDGRATLGQLSIEWRSAMGDRGFLTTGNLLTKKR